MFKKKVPITEEDPVFFVRYIGNTETFVPSGKGCTDAPLQKIWDSSTEERNMSRVALRINKTGMLMVNPETKQEFMFGIEQLSYCAPDRAINDRIVCWVYKLPEKQKLYCHAAICSSKEKAQAVALVLSRAFQVAFKEWKTNSAKVQRQRSLSQDEAKTKKSISKGEKRAESRISVDSGVSYDGDMATNNGVSTISLPVTQNPLFNDGNELLDASFRARAEGNPAVQALMNGDGSGNGNI
ncbi:protein FAM43A [Lingula anatina]|uniref:Protein FAM43A n=1 Tax=Lingula anatina TaxID=7574 RepID=A0A1S3J477_LINAN|nr:protein FAM43A [Lingula anatina]XP_013405240.1 protein FAM43A [Lingula anatina]XP_013405241.1 protein FAM43A [Lingula anatina]XP_013405242.1 protein FAM43A [Lingula anatina]|eukprot:XP_013405239.1 protein FAM43A [Lingula anatina]